MHNEKIFEELVLQFGTAQTYLYCRMEALRNDLLYKDCVNNNNTEVNECFAYDFERDWWKAKELELDAKLKNNYKYEHA